MHEFLTRYIFFCGIVASMLWAGTTFAEERLVMPFSCQSSGGRVVLNPAPPQSYRIFGAPEHQRFTSCSPNRPELCRDWMVHRFDLDCNGARVSWLTVVDAFTKMGPGRASVSNGRLHLRMRPWWNGGSPAPCDMRPPFAYGPWGYGRLAHGWPCPRPSLSAREPVVDMPAGFAPFFGPFARFTVPEATDPAAISAGAASQHPVAGRNPPAEHFASDVMDGSAPPAAAPPSAKTAPRDVAGSPSKAGKNIVGGDSTASLPKERVASLPRSSAPTANLSLDQTPMTSGGTDSVSSRLLGFALAIVLLLAFLFASARRVEPMNAEVATGQPGAAQPSFTSEPVAPRSPMPRPVPTDAEWLPSNRSEALQVLGASSETAQDILKKMVRTLRQTWHPDLARREEERRVRGLRLKQINVAWDIICGKRASA